MEVRDGKTGSVVDDVYHFLLGGNSLFPSRCTKVLQRVSYEPGFLVDLSISATCVLEVSSGP